MPTVKKLDTKRRAVFPDNFAPGDLFLEEISGDQIIFRLIQPEAVPLAETSDDNGWLTIKTPVSREAIAQAIRDERDSR